ncbi:hypothetical protein RUM8411_04467 [Ruegeria meonggei]|uniref:Uncharacterized protein n=1 Tax=Ruegeria meonggei TaxID=1446476 RepID=A0A1X7AFF0_9RHOB|nr:hypothetical protein RUM8411_04467 [Ruegeria meonggei]
MNIFGGKLRFCYDLSLQIFAILEPATVSQQIKGMTSAAVTLLRLS